jgi:TPR repeat protein
MTAEQILASEPQTAEDYFRVGYELLHPSKGQRSRPAKARPFIEQAAAMDHPQALYELGKIYLKGYSPEPEKAFPLMYRAAVHYDLPEAQWDLSVMYYTGFGAPVNSEAAKIMKNRAAEQGNELARRSITGSGSMKWSMEKADEYFGNEPDASKTKVLGFRAMRLFGIASPGQ